MKSITLLLLFTFCLSIGCLTPKKVERDINDIEVANEKNLEQSKKEVERIKHLISDYLIIQLEDYMLVVDSMQRNLDKQVQFLTQQKKISEKRVGRFQKREQKKINSYKDKKAMTERIIQQEFTTKYPYSQICFEVKESKQHCTSLLDAMICQFEEKVTSEEVVTAERERDSPPTTKTIYHYEVSILLKNINSYYETTVSSITDNDRVTAYRKAIADFVNKIEIHKKYFANSSSSQH